MSVDLATSEIARIMAEFERYTKDTPGNRWIQKNIVPVSSALGPLLVAAAVVGDAVVAVRVAGCARDSVVVAVAVVMVS